MLEKGSDRFMATEYHLVSECELYDLGDVELVSGMTLRNAQLAYKTFGELNEKKDNAIVIPTYFTGTHDSDAYLISEDRALNPKEYFIILVNQFNNGISSSPSNTPVPFDQASFPKITTLDNVRCQHQLVTEKFGIEKIKLVCGYSMGAQQTFQWGAAYPDLVERILPWCGTASTTTHNKVFIDGIEAILQLDPAFKIGYYQTEQPTSGLRAVGRMYAGWGFSQRFYYDHLYKRLGFSSLEDFLVGFWEAFFITKDANNLLGQLWTWKHSDIGNTPGCTGDRTIALNQIKAKAIVMAGATDLYFPVEDLKAEAHQIPNAEFREIPSQYGHFAGIGMIEEDDVFIEQALRDILLQ